MSLAVRELLRSRPEANLTIAVNLWERVKKDIWSVKTALFFGGLRAFCAPPPTTGGVNTSQPPGAVMGSGPRATPNWQMRAVVQPFFA
jgi:hypothetical protein